MGCTIILVCLAYGGSRIYLRGHSHQASLKVSNHNHGNEESHFSYPQMQTHTLQVRLSSINLTEMATSGRSIRMKKKRYAQDELWLPIRSVFRETPF